MSKLKTNTPPKDREFLGLVSSDHLGNRYWDFFWWAKKIDGVDKAQFVDRGYYTMPEIIGWMEVPSLEEEDEE